MNFRLLRKYLISFILFIVVVPSLAAALGNYLFSNYKDKVLKSKSDQLEQLSEISNNYIELNNLVVQHEYMSGVAPILSNWDEFEDIIVTNHSSLPLYFAVISKDSVYKDNLKSLNISAEALEELEKIYIKEQKLNKIIINDVSYAVTEKVTDDYKLIFIQELSQEEELISEFYTRSIWGFSLISAFSIIGFILLISQNKRDEDGIISLLEHQNISAIEPEKFEILSKKSNIAFAIMKFSEKVKTAIGRSDKYASEIAHELRIPLTILRGEIDIKLNKYGDEEFGDFLSTSLEEVIRMQNMINSLLEISGAEMGKIKINKGRNNLSEIVLDISEDTEALASTKHITVKKNIEKNLILEFDPLRMRQAIWNIIDNSIKYTDENGEIHILLNKNSHFAELSIIDNGIGIAQNELDKIFDKFYRIDNNNSSSYKGIGLGLSIVKWIIESHNGQISVSSKLKRGTSINIKIPMH